MINLIVLGIAPNFWYSKYSLQQFLDIQVEPYHLVSFIQPNRMQNLFPRATILDASSYIKSDWLVGRNILKDLVEPYNKILFFFAPVTKGLTPRSIELFRAGTIKNPQKGMSFSSTFKEYKKILFCLDSGLPVTHVINDDLEPDLSSFGVKETCFYEIPGRASYSDYIEKEIVLQDGPLIKDISFTFGFSNVSKIEFRTKLYRELKELDIPFTYKGPEEDSLLSVEEYNKLLRRSKYTYLIPSYSPDACSLIRILEAQHRGVKVLAHPDCNFNRINTQQHKNILEQIEIVDPKYLKERISD